MTLRTGRRLDSGTVCEEFRDMMYPSWAIILLVVLGCWLLLRSEIFIKAVSLPRISGEAPTFENPRTIYNVIFTLKGSSESILPRFHESNSLTHVYSPVA